jgi:ligand-binding sensor domain-containing protein
MAVLNAMLANADQGPGQRAGADFAVDWTWMPGLVREIVEGRDSTLWALGTVAIEGDRQLFRATPFGWTLVAGAFGCALAVGADGKPWLANAKGVIRFFDGTSWVVHPGRARSIAVSADGTLWIVEVTEKAGDGPLKRWVDGAFFDSGFAASRLKTDAIGVVLAVAADGTGMRLARRTWRRIARNVSDLAVDRAGAIWAASRGAGRIWRLDARSAVWRRAQASNAVRLLGRRDGSLLAVQADGAMFTGRARDHQPGILNSARQA